MHVRSVMTGPDNSYSIIIRASARASTLIALIPIIQL